jgi:hypothetical protein
MLDEEFKELIDALKTKALGNTIEQTTETWEKDKDTNKMKLTGKVVKKISYDIDTQACIKLIDIELKQRELDKSQDKYSQMSDEELQAEKTRLLKKLHEESEGNT